MKKLILLIIILFNNNLFSQNWEYSKEVGFNNPYVVSVDGSNASDLYKSALKYFRTIFVDPDKVLVSNTKNELLKIRGLTGNPPNEVRVLVLLEFKDNKYRVTPQRLEFFPSKVEFAPNHFFKKDGSIKRINGKVLIVAEDFLRSMQIGIKSGLNAKDDDW